MEFKDPYSFDPIHKDFEIMENIEGSFIGEESIFNLPASYSAIVDSLILECYVCKSLNF